MTPAPYHAELADGPDRARAYWLTTADRVRIRVGVFPASEPRGTLLIFPGRTEFIEKYGRTARDFVQRGYTVLVVDWRGQGLADRLMADPRIGHVDRFTDYQLDVGAVVDAGTQLNLPQPWHVLAHSMGGCIALRAVNEGLPVCSAAFSAPMWGIQMSAVTRPAAWAISWGASRAGLGQVIVPGMKTQSYIATEPFETNSLTRDHEMFRYMRRQVVSDPAFQLGGPSLRWLSEALQECRTLAALPSPNVPAVTFLGGQEKIICPQRIKDRMAAWPNARLELLPEAEHEVLMEGPETRAHVTNLCTALFESCASGRTETVRSA